MGACRAPRTTRSASSEGATGCPSELGSGAMGTVWSGYDDVLQRRVAIKELKVPPGVPEQEARDLRERIMREARALGGLSHPNVITVFDVVVDDGQPVVVLELVPSRNLATMIGENGALTAGAGRGRRVRHGGRPARGAPRGHHPPRRQAGQRPHRRRRPRQAHRLRHRPQLRRRAHDQRRASCSAHPRTSRPRWRRASRSRPPPTCGASAPPSSPPSRAARPTTCTATPCRRSPRSSTARCRGRAGRARSSTSSPR